MRARPSHTFSVTSHPPLRTLTVPPSYTSVLWQDAVATGGGYRRRGDVRWAGTDRSSTHHPTRPRSFAGAPPRPVHIIHGAHTMHAQCLHRAYTVHTCSEYTVHPVYIQSVRAGPGTGLPYGLHLGGGLARDRVCVGYARRQRRGELCGRYAPPLGRAARKAQRYSAGRPAGSGGGSGWRRRRR